MVLCLGIRVSFRATTQRRRAGDPWTGCPAQGVEWDAHSAIWLRRKDSNPRRRWVTATRSPTELLRTAWGGPQACPRTATGYRPPASGMRTRRTSFIRWRLGDAGRFRSDILRVEGPACSRCTTAPERKVEVSNPHGRTVSLFSKQGAPANEAYLPRRRGSGSNAGEVALGRRLASEHLSSRSTLQCRKSASSHSCRQRPRPDSNEHSPV